MLVETTKDTGVQEDICCPPFRPEQWDETTHTWVHKIFLTATVPEIFHIPLPGTYARAVTRMWKKAAAAGAAPDPADTFIMAHDPSSFKSELYMAVTREIPGARTVSISGRFFSKVFEGPYADVRRFLRDANFIMAEKGLSSRKDFVYFPYCPKCAKKYGHNYVVIVSEVRS